MSGIRLIVSLLAGLSVSASAQMSEDFDRLTPPALPPGWSSSSARTASDFITTSSLPASSPHCVLATNATVAQWLSSPPLDVSGLLLRSFNFQSRRSSTFRAGLVVEASTDGGGEFSVLLGDTLGSGPIAGLYQAYRLEIPPGVEGSLQIRFRVIPDRSGSTGTLRIDDVWIEAVALQDLSLCALRFAPRLPGQELEALVEIANSGLLPVARCEIAVALDADGDSTFAPHERFIRSVVPPAPGESLWVRVEAGEAPSHATRAVAELALEADRNRENNRLEVLFRPGVAPGTIAFNEIMFAPLSGEPEYLELAVKADYDGTLADWQLLWAPAGSSPTGSYRFLDSAALGGSFVVVASDMPGYPGISGEEPHLLIASDLVLRNDGGLLVLRDPAGMTSDSLQYTPAWHTPSVVESRGRSLEKILPGLPSADGRNWATCTELAGGTPGRSNSVCVAPEETQAVLGCSPNPFSPDGDGHDDWTVVRYQFPRAVHAVDLTVHDARGRMVRHLATRELGGRSGTVLWDGRNDGQETVRMGIYVVAIQGVDQHGDALLTARAAVVVARPLH